MKIISVGEVFSVLAKNLKQTIQLIMFVWRTNTTCHGNGGHTNSGREKIYSIKVYRSVKKAIPLRILILWKSCFTNWFNCGSSKHETRCILIEGTCKKGWKRSFLTPADLARRKTSTTTANQFSMWFSQRHANRLFKHVCYKIIICTIVRWQTIMWKRQRMSRRHGANREKVANYGWSWYYGGVKLKMSRNLIVLCEIKFVVCKNDWKKTSRINNV